MALRFHSISSCDVNNGEGFRVTLWVAGCAHHCPGCQNPLTWDFHGGRPFTERDKAYLFAQLAPPYIQGVTFSGGDPLGSPEDVIALSRELRAKMPDKDQWLYTGYTLEQIQASPTLSPILKTIDVLVDGPFVLAQRDVTLPFRGSRNQRVIRLGRKG